jgi:hypothetical protein
MKLSHIESDTLNRLYVDKKWPNYTTKAHKNTINSLMRKGFIVCVLYAKGQHFKLTNKGINYARAEMLIKVVGIKTIQLIIGSIIYEKLVKPLLINQKS